jgi:CBS domain containing-hemolysin-like protein
MLATWILVAEAAALIGASLEVALERHSRAGVLDAAGTDERRAQAEAELRHYGAHLFDARLLRFLGNALLVAGVAYLAFRDSLGSVEGIPWSRLGLVLAITFGLAFLLNEIVVRQVGRRDPDRVVLGSLPILRALRYAFAPVRWPIVQLVRLIFRVDLDGAAASARQEVLESVEEGEREGSLTRSEAHMIESIMDFGESTVKDVMTTRADMVMLPVSATADEGIQHITEHGVSRVPVYEKDRDHVVGVLYARDLLSHWRDPRARAREGDEDALLVSSVMRDKPFFVPETKAIGDLLAEMRARRIHLAVVVDEYGGTAGLVTIEDLLEEIVGEIRDEYDEDEVDEPPTPMGRPTLEPMDLEGRTPIEEINRLLAVTLPVEEDFETIGGLVFHQLGSVPEAGNQLEIEGVAVTVLEADERTVQLVRVQRQPELLDE